MPVLFLGLLGLLAPLATLPQPAAAGSMIVDFRNEAVAPGPDLGSSLFTIALWVKMSDSQAVILHQTSATTDSEFILRTKSGRAEFSIATPDMELTATGNSGSPELSDEQWHYLAGVRTDLRSIAVYLDGSLVQTSFTLSGSVTLATDGPMYIGKHAVEFFLSPINDVFVDEVRLWTRALTQAELQSTANANVAGSSGLARYYKFNTAGTISTDSSGSGYDLTQAGTFEEDDAPLIDGAVCSFECAPGGTCVLGACSCSDGFSGPACDPITADAAATTASGPGLFGSSAGADAVFTVTAVDSTGAPRTTGGDDVRVEIACCGGSGSLLDSVDVTDNNDGTYSVAYVATDASVHSIAVTLGPSDNIVGSPFTANVVAGPAHGPSCTVSGIADAQSFTVPTVAFQITAFDSFGNRAASGDASFTVSAGEGRTGTALHTSNGVYDASLTISAAASVSVAVSLPSGPVPGSPFAVTTVAGPVSATRTEGAFPTSIVAGESFAAQIFAFDDYGNPRVQDLADEFTYQLQSSPPTVIVLDGQYVRSAPNSHIYEIQDAAPELASTYQVLSLSPGTTLSLSSILTVSPAALDPASVAVLARPDTSEAGLDYVLEFRPRDEYDNPTELDPTLFRGFLRSTDAQTEIALEFSVAQTQTSLLATARPLRATEYDVILETSAGAALADAPYSLTVTFSQSFAPGSSLLDADGVLATSVPAGDPVSVVLQGKDIFGNDRPFPDAGNPVVVFADPVVSVDVSADLSGNGRHTLTLSADVADEYGVVVSELTSLTPLSGSPATLRIVAGPVDVGASTASGPGLEDGPVNIETSFTIVPRDEFGNVVQDPSPSTFPVTIVGPGASPVPSSSSTSGGPGQIVVSYTPTDPGLHAVTIAGNTLPGSPFSFDIFGPATLSTIAPALGPTTGETQITVTGTNFVPSSLFCRVGSADGVATYLDSTTMLCESPAVGAATTLAVTVSNTGVGYSSPVGPPGAFEYHVPFVVTSLTPSAGLTTGGTEVEISGANFFDSGPGLLVCQFGSTVVPATFLSSDTLLCLSPEGAPGVIRVSVASNAQQFVGRIPFSRTDSFSSLCRDPSELSIGVQERINSGFEYFPNLALRDAVVAPSTDAGYAPYTVTGDIIDGDRCCEATGANEGFKCGLAFPSKPFGQQVTIEIELAGDAFVNEIVSSWYEPCRNEPVDLFTLQVEDSEGDWVDLVIRSPDQEPCYTIPSDIGQASICIDYFLPVRGRSFRLLFANDEATMGIIPEQTDGGWIYELEVHGIFVDEAYELRVSPAVLGDQPSAAALALGPLDIVTANFEGTVLGAQDAGTWVVEVRLLRSGTDVTDTILQGTTAGIVTQGLAEFDDLVMAAPEAGSYQLVFSVADDLLPAVTIDFEVVPGVPTELRFQDATDLELRSLIESPVPARVVQAFDAGGNFVGADDAAARPITARLEDAQGTDVTAELLAGSLTSTMTDGAAVFDDLSLLSPPAGRYALIYESAGLASTELGLVVGAGPPVELVVVPLTRAAIQVRSALAVVVPPIELGVRDAGASILADSDTQSRLVDASSSLVLSSGVTVVMRSGSVVFDSLVIDRPASGSFNLTFASFGLEPAEIALEILVGNAAGLWAEPEVPGAISVPAGELVALPGIAVESQDQGGNSLGASDPLSRVVLATAVRVSGQAEPGPAELDGTVTETLVGGRVVFSGLQLLLPTAGTYRLEFASADLAPATLEIEVTTGPVARLVPSVPSIEVVSSEVVALPPISVQMADVAGNLAGAADTASRTVTASITANGAGVALDGGDSETSEDGLANFGSLVVPAPLAGRYDLVFESPGLDPVTVELVVEVGTPRALQLASPVNPMIVVECTDDVAITQIVVQAADAGGSFVSDDPVNRVVNTAFTTFATGVFLDGGPDSEQMVGGSLSFQFRIRGQGSPAPPLGRYEIEFLSFGLSPVTLTIDVVNGPPRHLVLESAGRLTLPSAYSVPVAPPVRLGVLDAGFNEIGSAYRQVPYQIEASVQAAEAISWAVRPTGSKAVLQFGNVTFTNLVLESPQMGVWTIAFAHPGFVAATIEVEVTVGFPQQLALDQGESVAVSSAPVSELPPLRVQAVDAGMNPVGDLFPSENRHVLLEAAALALRGSTNITMDANNSVVFDDVSVSAPVPGTYALLVRVESGDLAPVRFDLVVAPGAPARLSLQQTAAQIISVDGILDGPSPRLELLDEVGNPVARSLKVGVVAEVTPEPPQGSSQILVVSEGAVVNYDEVFSFLGVPGRDYAVEFIVVSPPEIAAVIDSVEHPQNITVESCLEFKAFSQGFGNGCACQPGYTLQDGEDASSPCTPCPKGTFKETVGDGECRGCGANKDTADLGQASVTACTCREGFYSLTADGECFPCRNGAVCAGGTSIVPAAGFWSPDAESLIYVECPVQGTCLGGAGSPCSDGYKGALCAVCSAGFSGYGSNCEKCPPSSTSGFVLFLLIVMLVLLLIFMVRLASGPKTTAMTTTKILVSFFQQVALVGAFNFPWPQGISGIMEFFAISTLSTDTLSFGCSLSLSFYGRFWYYMLLPVVSVGLVLLLVLVMYVYLHFSEAHSGVRQERERAIREQLRSFAVTSMVVMLYLSHPPITRQVLEVFYCTSAGDGSYLVADMSIRCGTDTHTAAVVIGVIMFVFYVIGLPAMSVLLVLRHKHKLQTPRWLKYRFLFEGYSDRYYWWEWVVMARKMLLALFVVMLRTLPKVQLFFATCELLLSMSAHQLFRPHIFAIHRRMEFGALLTTYVLLASGAILSDTNLSAAGRDALDAVVVLVLSLVLVGFAFVILSSYVTYERLAKVSSWYATMFKSEDTMDDDVVMQTNKRRTGDGGSFVEMDDM